MAPNAPRATDSGLIALDLARHRRGRVELVDVAARYQPDQVVLDHGEVAIAVAKLDPVEHGGQLPRRDSRDLLDERVIHEDEPEGLVDVVLDQLGVERGEVDESRAELHLGLDRGCAKTGERLLA